MGTARRLLLAVVVVTLPAAHAAAQMMMPWPGDPRAGGGGGAAAPWPGTGGAAPQPMMGAPQPPIGGGGMAGGGGGSMPPCMAEFAKFREEVEKRGKAAKAAGEHHAGREEMCKHLIAFSDAETRWIKYTEANVQACSIPVQIVNQLKQNHSGTESARQRICNAPAAAGPSLSDAVGTTRLGGDSIKMGNGTLDTLTGPAIR